MSNSGKRRKGFGLAIVQRWRLARGCSRDLTDRRVDGRPRALHFAADIRQETAWTMTKLTPESKKKLRSRSRLVHLGRDSEANHGFINFPAYRGSTVLFPDVETLKSRKQRYTYGTHGTPTTDALCEAWSDIAGAAGTVLVPSGLFAIIAALTTALSAGDHLLMTDAAYQPARNYCDTLLKRMGVETTYYDPAIGAGIARPDARQYARDFRRGAGLAIARHAGCPGDRGGGARARASASSWTTPGRRRCSSRRMRMASIWRSRPARNISPAIPTCCSASSRPMPNGFRACKRRSTRSRVQPGPEDVYLALRGLRTMELRLREAERQALALAHWLKGRAEVRGVIHPALPDYPGHEIWKRDFTGSSGLFSIVLNPVPDRRASRPCWTGSNCSAWAIPGAASKASSSPSIARNTAPRRVGRRAARRCDFRSVSKISKT